MFRLLITLLIGLILSGCNNNSKSSKKTNIKNINGTPIIEYSIKKNLPHSTDSYTEGFIFHDDKLYESTGSPEEYPNPRSVIGIVNLKTGKIDVKVEIDRNKYFGEGILFFNNKLYQLTYKNQLGFIYDSKTFKQIGTFTYANKEGWGMTSDGKSIIMSDGTNFITYWDPENLKEIKKINITYNGASALYANELEYINGYIYANVWTTNYIAKIDTADGKIVGLIDLTSLFQRAKRENPLSEATNGIAYDSKKDRVFVTGKFWPYIFEIKFQH
jgi:glutaminyl-peptide cyclotransferase